MNRHARRAAAAQLAPAVRTSSNKKVFDYKQTKFWAERGLIHTVLETTGEYTTCSVREWLLRAQAFSAQAWREKYADEREAIVSLVENMVKVAKQAKGQGDPHTRQGIDEAVRRLPTQILLPEVVYSYKGAHRRIDKATPPAGIVSTSEPAVIVPGDAKFTMPGGST